MLGGGRELRCMGVEMRYLSVCSGIEAASVAWKTLGWSAVGFSEIEKFPCSVLKYRYPETENFGDMTKFKEWPDANIDVLVGGTPCQSFSIAGLRKGLDDPRGNLMLTYLAIADRYKPKYIVWENVAGILSSNGGRDFGTFLGGLGKLGYGFAYRVLDAQFCRTHEHPRAVPQRRRRVFVVGCFGDWRSAAGILFDSESLRGNPPPSRKKGQEVAPTISKCSFSGGAGGRPEGAAGNHFLPVTYSDISLCLTKGTGQRYDCETETFALAGNTIGREPLQGGNGDGFDDTGSSYTLTKTDIHAVAYRTNAAGQINDQGDVAACINTFTDPNSQFLLYAHGIAVAFAQNTRDEVRLINGDGQIAGALAAQPGMKQTTYVQQQMRVRRLTPLECERLQGFPDFWTDIPGASNTARYKALGNSMAVNSMRILGERIAMAESIL